MKVASRIIADDPVSAQSEPTTVGDPQPGTTPYRKRDWWKVSRRDLTAAQVADKAAALAENTAQTCSEDGCSTNRSGFGKYCTTHGAVARDRMKARWAAGSEQTAANRAAYELALTNATTLADVANGKLKAPALKAEPSASVTVPKRAGFGQFFASEVVQTSLADLPSNLTYVWTFAESLRASGYEAAVVPV